MENVIITLVIKNDYIFIRRMQSIVNYLSFNSVKLFDETFNFLLGYVYLNVFDKVRFWDHQKSNLIFILQSSVIFNNLNTLLQSF